ncbi:hypothetical protein CN918_29845 [Priestia megaterium]|nr:hypothetical protein CN918_29845 [Priestia megaterium]
MKRKSKWMLGLAAAVVIGGGITATVVPSVSAESSSVTVLKEETPTGLEWSKTGNTSLGKITVEQVSERQIEFVIKGETGPGEYESIRGVALLEPNSNKAVYHNPLNKMTTTLILHDDYVKVISSGQNEEYKPGEKYEGGEQMPWTFDGIYTYLTH